jgi:RNase H-like domain found in reverse transcriptase/Aspartyl protease
MCTFSSLQKHKTSKFKGKIKHIDIIAMVDSGSTHSFINPSIVHTLSIPTLLSYPITVTTASGAQMSQAHVLDVPDFSKPFIIETDASQYGIGAVLMQDKHPIAFLSQKLGIRNQGLSIYEMELLALIIAVTK